MGAVRVRRSRLPVIASALMILLGAGTFVFVNHIVGILLSALGLLMYFVYRRLANRTAASSIAEG